MLVPLFQDGKAVILPSGAQRAATGTGWLIALQLIFTNYHVIKARKDGEKPEPAHLQMQAANTLIQFDYDYKEAPGNVSTRRILWRRTRGCIMRF